MHYNVEYLRLAARNIFLRTWHFLQELYTVNLILSELIRNCIITIILENTLFHICKSREIFNLIVKFDCNK